MGLLREITGQRRNRKFEYSLPDGGLVLQRAVALTPAEAAHYRDLDSIAALESGWADAEAGRTLRGELRSEQQDG